MRPPVHTIHGRRLMLIFSLSCKLARQSSAEEKEPVDSRMSYSKCPGQLLSPPLFMDKTVQNRVQRSLQAVGHCHKYNTYNTDHLWLPK